MNYYRAVGLQRREPSMSVPCPLFLSFVIFLLAYIRQIPYNGQPVN